MTNSPAAQQRTPEQALETMNRRFVGKRVLIIGDHPHVDRIGVVDRAEKTLVGWGYVVNFPQGDSCFVFSGKHWRILERGGGLFNYEQCLHSYCGR